MNSPDDHSAEITRPANSWWGRLTNHQRAATVGGGVLVLMVVLALVLRGGEPKETKTTVLTNGQEEQPLETAKPQPVIWKQPVVLFAGADDSVDRYDPAVTDGGLTLVFVAGLPRQGADLYRSTRVRPNDEWGDPEPLANLNTDADELGPAFSFDGKFLFFSSDRDGGQGGYDLWVSRNENGNWSEPVNLDPGINTALDEIDPFIRRPMDEPGNTGNRLHPAGLYYASNQPAVGEPAAKLPRWRGTARRELVPQSENFDIFLARIEAETLAETQPPSAHPWKFAQPERLDHLNTSGSDAMPAIMQDGDYLYFASNREGGAGGFDILSARWHPEAHRVPQGEGSAINTHANETDPALFDKGDDMIFSSDRGSGENPTYQLFQSQTIRVYEEEQVAEVTPRASAGGFWNFLRDNWLWILLLLLALLALLALLGNLLNEERRRVLSMLQRCLLGSLVLHILVAIILLFITITADIFPAGKETVAEEEILELALNEGNLAVQQMSQDIRESVPELPQAKANLPTEQPVQPAPATAQQPTSEPARPVPVQPQAQPNVLIIEPPKVQPPPIPAETLAKLPELTPLPELPERTPLRMELEQTQARAQPNQALAQVQPTQQVNPAATVQAQASPKAAEPQALEPAQLPAASVQLPATPELAEVTPVKIEPPAPTALPTAQAAKTGVTQEQATAQARANQQLSQAKVQPNAQAAKTQNAKANPQVTTQQNVKTAKAAKVASAQATNPVKAQANAETVQTAQAETSLPQMEDVKATPRQEQGTAQSQAGKAFSQATAQANAQAGKTQDAQANPQATTQQNVKTAPVAKVASTQTTGPVKAQAAAEAVQTAQAKFKLAQVQADAANTAPEQGTAKADAGSRLAAAKGSQSLPAAATSQVPTEGPKTTALEPVKSAEANISAAVQKGKFSGVQNADVQLAAATTSQDLPTANQSAQAKLNLETAKAGSRLDRQLAQATNNQAVKATAQESQSVAQAAMAQTVSAAKQVANAAVTNAAPALVTAPAGALNTAKLSPSLAPSSALSANPANLETVNAKSKAATALVAAQASANPSAAKGSTAQAVTSAQANTTAPKVKVAAARILAGVDQAGPVSARAEAAQVKAEPFQSRLPKLQVAQTPAPKLEMIAPTVSASKQLGSAEAGGTLASAQLVTAPAKAQPPATSMVAVIGLNQVLKPNLKTAPAVGSAVLGSLANAKTTAGGVSAADLLPLKVESFDQKTDPSQVAGKSLKAAKGTAKVRASAAPFPAPAGGPVEVEKLVQSKALPKLGVLQMADLHSLDLNVDPLVLPGTGQELALPARQINPGVVLEAAKNQVSPLVLRKDPKLRLNYIERLGGSDETEKAVRRALDWFTRNQEKNGCWRGEAGHYTGATGMAMLAYMGWGAQHTEPGPHQKQLAKAVEWMLREEFNGDLRGRAHRGNMYDHGIAAIAMAEAYALTKDPRLLQPMKRIVAFTVRAQNPKTGGWRYQTYQENPNDKGDMSVTGWQLMALKSAELGGLAVPKKSFDRVSSFLDFVGTGKHRGDYRYIPRFGVRHAMIAEGMFCQQLLGLSPTLPRMRESVKYLQQKMPSRKDVNYYYWYYASLAMHQNQGEPWEKWNQAIRPILLRNQVRNGRREDGSWDPVGKWGKESGRCVTTAMATLSLEVYYRYLPLSSPKWLRRRGLNGKTGGGD
jgi:hypothetical protein